MTTRQDESGTWTRLRDVWVLTEPSEQWTADHPAVEHPISPDPLVVIARMVVAPMIAADELDGDTLTAVAALFPGWQPGEPVNTGDMKAWADGVAEAATAHHSTKTPDDAPTLWHVHRKETT